MDSVNLSALLGWLQQHPVVSLITVFLVAFGESLAFVGLIVPGALLMVGFGALIALDYLPFWPTIIAAMLGAIAGDGVSYWLGAYYNQRLTTLWPFTRHPDLLERGKDFFNRHGGKSVLLGRFFGPLRPIIPAIAGMMHMSVRQFILINIISAILWAPLYLLPGIIFGASLELASEFAGRFSLLLVTLLVSLWLLGWLIKKFYMWVVPISDAIMVRLLNWSRRHPVAGEIPAAIISSDHPEVRGLSMLALLLLMATAGFISVSQMDVHLPFIQNLNHLAYHTLQAMHNPPFDHAMTMFNSLGDTVLLSLIVIVVALVLVVQRHWLALWHWLAAFLFPLLLVGLLNYFYTAPRPPLITTLEYGTELSGHIVLSMAVYGFLAILLVRDIKPRYHLMVYLAVASLIMMIAFARLYLGAQWLTNVMGGLLLGLAWTSLLGIAYRRHATQRAFNQRNGLLLTVLLIISLSSYPVMVHKQQLTRFQPLPTEYVMTRQAWLTSGWQVFPAVRQDLRSYNDFSFNLQWRGNESGITRVLKENGWVISYNSIGRYFNWFNSSATHSELPVLPHVHAGQYERLRMVKLSDDGNLYVIRLWPSHIEVTNHQQSLPVWYGNISQLNLVNHVGLVYLVTACDFNTPLIRFKRQVNIPHASFYERQGIAPSPGKEPVYILLIDSN